MCNVPTTNITVGTQKQYLSMVWSHRIKSEVLSVLVLSSKLDDLFGSPWGNVEAHAAILALLQS